MHTHGQKHIPFLSISLAASPLPTQQSSSRAMQQEYRRTCLPEHYTTLAQCRGCQERGENRGRRGHQGKGTGQDTAAARRQSSLWPAVAGIHSELKPWPTARGYGCRSTVSQQFRCEGWEILILRIILKCLTLYILTLLSYYRLDLKTNASTETLNEPPSCRSPLVVKPIAIPHFPQR